MTEYKRPGKYSGSSSSRTPGNNNSENRREKRPRKSYADHDSGEHRKNRSSEDSGRKPFRKHEDGSEKKYSDKRTGERKPFRKREEGGDKRYSDKRTGERKPYRKKEYDSKGRFAEKKQRYGYKTRPEKDKAGSDEIRLNRYIASTGNCSRRQADEFIRLGLVSVNGVTVTEMGIKVKPGDVVKLNGDTIKPEKKVYILMNKPKDYITTTDDPQERKIVTDLLDREWQGKVYPVGRLDRNTTGVLLLTNDGDLTRKLLHPSQKKKKVYHVFLDKNLKSIHLHQLLEGIELEDGPVAADAVQYVSETDKSQVGVELHSGKYHIIKRMFEYLGYQVTKLDRVYFAGLTKKGLERGQWRFLTEKEINMLRIGAFD